MFNGRGRGGGQGGGRNGRGGGYGRGGRYGRGAGYGRGGGYGRRGGYGHYQGPGHNPIGGAFGPSSNYHDQGQGQRQIQGQNGADNHIQRRGGYGGTGPQSERSAITVDVNPGVQQASFPFLGLGASGTRSRAMFLQAPTNGEFNAARNEMTAANGGVRPDIVLVTSDIGDAARRRAIVAARHGNSSLVMARRRDAARGPSNPFRLRREQQPAAPAQPQQIEAPPQPDQTGGGQGGTNQDWGQLRAQQEEAGFAGRGGRGGPSGNVRGSGAGRAQTLPFYTHRQAQRDRQLGQSRVSQQIPAPRDRGRGDERHGQAEARTPTATADSDMQPRPLSDQQVLLEKTCPYPLGSRLKEVEEGDPNREVGPGLWSESQRSSIDSLLLVLRTVGLHSEQELDAGVRNGPIKSAHKVICALVEYSWGHGNASVPHLDGDREPSGDVAVEQIKLYKALSGCEGLAPESKVRKDFSIFLSLMESAEMHQYLWSREDLLMWSGQEIRILPDGKGEVKLWTKICPEGKDMFSASDDAAEKSSVKFLGRDTQEKWNYLAKWSLIEWKGDVSLEEYLARLTISWTEHNGKVHRWISEWERNGRFPPTILRVRYTPETIESWSGFTSLATLRFCPDVCYEDKREQTFNLVAVVRLAETSLDSTYVRVYSAKTGEPLYPTGPRVRKPAHFNDGWKLGEIGHSYMLYYVQSPMPPSKEPQEICN
ncbi:hypothetical protein N0V82_003600 [Gnomoniopsis sp. IMI 355080]|nr:hypothetical protein N0V82_003600 [Gnomoniopsis sp. IMI 355080]